MLTVKLIVQSPTFLAVVAAVAIFVLDLQLPNGVVDGILYVLVALLSARIPRPRATLWAAAALTPLMVLGFVFSPMAAPLWVAITNRVVSMAVLWITAALLWRHAQSPAAEEKSELPQIPLLLTSAVRDDLVLQLGIIEWRLQRLPYFAGRASDLKREALVLTSALKNARHSVRTMDLKIHALDELTLANK